MSSGALRIQNRIAVTDGVCQLNAVVHFGSLSETQRERRTFAIACLGQKQLASRHNLPKLAPGFDRRAGGILRTRVPGIRHLHSARSARVGQYVRNCESKTVKRATGRSNLVPRECRPVQTNCSIGIRTIRTVGSWV